MNKKILVVLVVVTAILVTGSLVVAAKRGLITSDVTKLPLQKYTAKQSVTAIPQHTLTTQQTSLPFTFGSNEMADRAVGVPFTVANPGDILWDCNVANYNPPDSEYQVLGVETLRDTIYITGGGNGADPNYIYVWKRVGGTCQYLYKIDQPITISTGWGWRDMAADNQYFYTAGSPDPTILRCFYVTPGGVVLVPANDIAFAPVGTIRAVAYDPVHDWFWTANFSSNIYAFNRAGTQMASYANTYAIYGLAFDTLSTPGQPYLWCLTQDNNKARQFDPATGTYTGVVYAGYGDAGGGLAGGMCMLEGNSSKSTATLLGVCQCTPVDEIFAMELVGTGPLGCCQFNTYCDMLSQADCQTAGGTWNTPPYVCVGTTCELPPPDTTCHLQWDDGGVAYYFGSWNVGDQNAVYYNPAVMCPGCGPDVFPFQLTQVSGIFYDFAAVGSVDVIVHIYDGADSSLGPGAGIYSFGPITVNTFYPTETIIPIPEPLCLDGPFFVAIEYASGSTGSIPCLLMDAQSPVVNIMWNWSDGTSPPWIEWYSFWTPPPPGYLMLRADGYCNSAACPIQCDLVQDHGAPAYYFDELSAGDQIAKYFDPEAYCLPPVYPYKIHDVDIALYDFAAVGSVDLRIGVSTVCQDSCDGPGTPLYLSDPITVTTFYPDMAHIVLPQQVCVWEPFFIVIQWASGTVGTTPSFLMEPESYPCDSCHGWMFFDGYSPPWIGWNDFWPAPVPGCPIVRVSGFTKHPDCTMLPCDTVQNVLADYGTPTWVWALPSTSGRNYPNQRFNLPATYGGRLDEVHFMFYGLAGDPNPTIYVWATDGAGHPSDNNPPYQALAEFPIPTSQVAPFPNMTVVQTWQRGVKFDPEDEFFVGYSFVFDPGDALALVSDDYTDPLNTSTRAGFYWPGDVPPDWLNVYEYYGVYMSFIVEAVICPEAPPESTFTLDVTPSPLYTTPGDPPVHYTAAIGQVLNYTLPVDLSLANISPSPAPGIISATFTPDNQPCPYSSDAAVTADALVPYGTYTLTFQGQGSDGQIRTKDVVLIVQPPFDECNVPFFHGSQKSSNFGAVGNDAATDNFLWYGLTSQLFDGSLIAATSGPATICLDVFNCEHWGFTPSQHANLYYDPKYNANICESHYYSEFIPGEWDSVFVVGIMENSIDFSIKIKIYYNVGPNPITGLYPALYEDWDVGDAQNNMIARDTLHNLMYQWDVADPNIVFGMMKAPFYDDPMYNIVGISNPRYVYPNAGFCDGWGLDSLYYLISTPGYYNTATSDTDMSQLMTGPPFDLPVGGRHVEVWIDFGRDLGDGLNWQQWWHRVLRYAGFYRGDANASDTLELPSIDVSDLVYLINYLFVAGPTPIPYVDQGDVNADGLVNIADCVYLINYVWVNGPAPIDYLRFIPQKWTRPSLFIDPNWR